MAHYQQQEFIKIASKHFPIFFAKKKILEVGSWDANGSIRKYFSDCEYIGADVAQGPGVDIVCPGQDISFPDNHFDMVISCECFEHNPSWIKTFQNMYRMLKPGGLCLITCASIGRGEHGTHRKSPDASLTVQAGHDEYYHNISKTAFKKAFPLEQMFIAYEMFYNIYFCDFYFIGIKKNPSEYDAISHRFITDVNHITESNTPGISRKITKFLNFWLTFVWATLLGEKKYHDIKFKLSHLLRKKRHDPN